MNGSPWAAAYLDLQAQLNPNEYWLDHANGIAASKGLCVTSGRILQFVEADTNSAADFERHIFAHGQVPTRIHPNWSQADRIHDWFHAQVWIRFTLSKARLNAMHVNALQSGAGNEKNRTQDRDRYTLFDENGLILAVQTRGDGPSMQAVESVLAAHDWTTLFIDWRPYWGSSLVPVCFGHGLLQKLQTPFKAITAKTVLLQVADPQDLQQLDQQLAHQLDLLLRRKLLPLPVMGIPGWHKDNQDASFYTDTTVFRK
jgi:Protein of unknown function (DUF3025)